MTREDQRLITEVQEYITSLEQIKKDLNRSILHDASHAAEHTLRLARKWLKELQQPT